MKGLAGKVCLVTGGARGIGLATVERLVEEEALVTFVDLDESRGRAEAARLGAAFHVADVAQERAVAWAVKAVEDAHGRLDVLVNNAGISSYFDATTATERDWDRTFSVDLKGAWLCAKHAIPLMRAHGGGSVVNIASIHAFMTTTGMFPYAGAKAGLVGLTRSLALDYGTENIRVNAVCPGYVSTHLVDEWLEHQPDPELAKRELLDKHPLHRIGAPAEIASLVAYLASDDSSYVTGAAWLIDGGLSARFA